MEVLDLLTYEAEHENKKEIVSKIMCEFEMILNKYFIECEPIISKLIFLEDNEIAKERGYKESDMKPFASVRKNNSLYNIIVVFDNVVLYKNGKKSLNANIKNHLFHELQHVHDHLLFDAKIEKYIKDNNIEWNQQVFGKMLFLEYRAAYYAQKYYRIEWEYNKYALETTQKEFYEKYKHIDSVIDELLDAFTEEKQKYAVEEAMEYSRKLLYKVAIASGTNAADNEVLKGKREIDIRIEGIQNDIDSAINQFITGLNTIGSYEDELLDYMFKNAYFVFNAINSQVKRKAGAKKL